MSTFPSILSVISDPTATNKLNSPSHSSIEQAQNDGIKKLETFIGTQASAVGTLMYDIRAAASDGGGHVQAANKGGTGQTTYTKGDVLVATSASVLSKLAVGSNNQALLADSNQAAGVKWAGVANAIDMQNQTYTYARASVISGSVYGVVLGQAVSILSDGLGLVVKFPAANASSIVALQVNATGPSSLTALVKNTRLGNLKVGVIQPSMIGVLEFDSVSSVFQIVNPLPTYNSGQTSRLGSAGTGTQNIAHGLGVTPRLIKITAVWSNDTPVAGFSFGSATSTTDDTVIHYDETSGGNKVGNNAAAIIHIASGADTIADVSVLDSTNITLNFSAMDGSAGSIVYIQWEAFT